MWQHLKPELPNLSKCGHLLNLTSRNILVNINKVEQIHFYAQAVKVCVKYLFSHKSMLVSPLLTRTFTPTIIEKWTTCFWHFRHGNTDMYLERWVNKDTVHVKSYLLCSFHNQLKSIYLNGKLNYRIDFLLHHLLQYKKMPFSAIRKTVNCHLPSIIVYLCISLCMYARNIAYHWPL